VPRAVLRTAAVSARKPRSGAWPNEGRPPTPVRSTSPIATSADSPILSSSTIQNGGMPGIDGIAAITAAKIRMGQRSVIASILLFLDRRRGQRAQQKHRDQQREDDDLLEIARIKR